jgi:hypothetical protein
MWLQLQYNCSRLLFSHKAILYNGIIMRSVIIGRVHNHAKHSPIVLRKHETAREPLNGFSWVSLRFEDFTSNTFAEIFSGGPPCQCWVKQHFRNLRQHSPHWHLWRRNMSETFCFDLTLMRLTATDFRALNFVFENCINIFRFVSPINLFRTSSATILCGRLQASRCV